MYNAAKISKSQKVSMQLILGGRVTYYNQHQFDTILYLHTIILV